MYSRIRNKLLTKKIYSRQIKYVSVNYQLNYFTPSNQSEEIEDVRNYLETQKPKYLCIYFTNSWNPVSLEAESKYTSFTQKTGSFRNLKIDVDMFPRLKWYFDSKFEPGFHFYYFGNLLSKFGGSNFDKAIKETERIKQYIDNNLDIGQYNQHNITYEAPYYEFEQNEIPKSGHIKGPDTYQSFNDANWLGLVSYKLDPLEERWYHARLKK